MNWTVHAWAEAERCPTPSASYDRSFAFALRPTRPFHSKALPIDSTGWRWHCCWLLGVSPTASQPATPTCCCLPAACLHVLGCLSGDACSIHPRNGDGGGAPTPRPHRRKGLPVCCRAAGVDRRCKQLCLSVCHDCIDSVTPANKSASSVCLGFTIRLLRAVSHRSIVGLSALLVAVQAMIWSPLLLQPCMLPPAPTCLATHTHTHPSLHTPTHLHERNQAGQEGSSQPASQREGAS